MKILLKTIEQSERGYVLITVFLILCLGAFLIAPSIYYMVAGLHAGQSVENRTEQLYAADAGIEDALLFLKTNGGLPGEPTDPVPLYKESEPTINGYTVKVMISEADTEIALPEAYRIISTAFLDDVPKTSVEVYAEVPSPSIDLLSAAIVSNGNVVIKPGATIDGDVIYHDILDNKGVITGQDYRLPGGIANWPDPDELAQFYLSSVPIGSPYPNASINIANTSSLLATYRDGDLSIDSTEADVTLTLGGTLYVTGNLNIAQSGNKSFSINLNSQTIFVEKNILAASKSNFIGPGSIIALGDINFQPNDAGDQFIFIMSVNGTTNLQPGGNFVGTVAGAANVELKAGNSLTWVEPPPGLNIPDWMRGSDDPVVNVYLKTWEVAVQ